MTNEERTIKDLRDTNRLFWDLYRDEREKSEKLGIMLESARFALRDPLSRKLEVACVRWQWFYFVVVAALGAACMILLLRGGR